MLFPLPVGSSFRFCQTGSYFPAGSQLKSCRLAVLLSHQLRTSPASEGSPPGPAPGASHPRSTACGHQGSTWLGALFIPVQSVLINGAGKGAALI